MSANSSFKPSAKWFKQIVAAYLAAPSATRLVPDGIVVKRTGEIETAQFADEAGNTAIYSYQSNPRTGQPKVTKITVTAPVNVDPAIIASSPRRVMPIPVDVVAETIDTDAIENPAVADPSADKPVAVAQAEPTSSDLTIKIEPKKRAVAAPVAAAHTVDEQLVALVATGNFLNGAGRNKAATDLMAVGFAFLKGSRIMATDDGKQRAAQLAQPVNVPVAEAVAV